MSRDRCWQMFFVISFMCCARPSEAAQFLSVPSEVDSGHVLLKWRSDRDRIGSPQSNDPQPRTVFIVESSDSGDFSDAAFVYKGSDRSTFISGLKDGSYFYRVRGEEEVEWSKPLVVKVEHFSSEVAFTLFALGLFSFAGIVGVIWQGNRLST